MKQFKFSPYPVLQTDRIRLRRVTVQDAETILFLRSNDVVNRFIDRQKLTGISDAVQYIDKINTRIANHEWIYWGISLSNHPDIIGTICLWRLSKERRYAELGYELTPEHHGKGIMSEALKAVIDYGFNVMQLSTIEAFTHSENSASVRLLERNHFTLQPERIDKGFPHNVVYTHHAKK